MSGIYKLWMSKPTDAWYQLSKEEQDGLVAKSREALEKVGGKAILTCTPAWSSERWLLFGVEEFPDAEAVQKHAGLLFEIDHYRYFEGTSMLGIEWPPS